MNEKGFSEDEARDTLSKGGLRIYSTMDMKLQKIVEKEFENTKNFPGSYKDSSGTVQPQASMVIMDHSSGEVRALVGGRMLGGNKIYNRAINPRQPGSAIKPLAVYLPALDKGMTAATVINDSPHYDDKGKLWPQNYDRKYGGPSTTRQLLMRSSNVGTVKLAEKLENTHQKSISTMVSYLKKLGISTLVTRASNPTTNDENFSLSLGGMSKGVTNLDLTAAYGAIANKGIHIEPMFFTRVETSDGSVLIENKPRTRKVVSAQTAYVMGDMLKSVVDSGTGTRAKISGMPVAGKTGTTSNNYDAWFVGYTPYYVGATWIGSDMPKSLSTGSKMSAALWQKIMSQAHSGLKTKQFEEPDGIVRASICTKSGKRPSSGCPSRTEVFVKGTQPSGHCTGHASSETGEDVQIEDPQTGDTDTAEELPAIEIKNPNQQEGSPSQATTPSNPATPAPEKPDTPVTPNENSTIPEGY